MLQTVDPTTSITQHPSDMSVNQGSNVTFSVEVHGEELTFIWLKDNKSISTESDRFTGRLTRTLNITNVQDADEGIYQCTVTNGAGDSVTSNGASLTVCE